MLNYINVISATSPPSSAVFFQGTRTQFTQSAPPRNITVACDHCEYVHEWKCRVNTHRLWVHKLEEPLKPRNTYRECDQCNDFDTEHLEEFKRHKSEVHSAVTRCYSCDECSFSTNSKHSLKRHTSLLHPRTSDGDSDIESIEIFTDESEEEDD